MEVYGKRCLDTTVGFRAGPGLNIPDWLTYGPIAIVLCMSLHYNARSYINVSSALRSINSELEGKGRICGATRPRLLKSITLPLVLPSILSSVVTPLSKAIDSFGIATNRGNRIGCYTLTVKRKGFINGSPRHVGDAMSVVLIALAARDRCGYRRSPAICHRLRLPEHGGANPFARDLRRCGGVPSSVLLSRLEAKKSLKAAEVTLRDIHWQGSGAVYRCHSSLLRNSWVRGF